MKYVVYKVGCGVLLVAGIYLMTKGFIGSGFLLLLLSGLGMVQD